MYSAVYNFILLLFNLIPYPEVEHSSSGLRGAAGRILIGPYWSCECVYNFLCVLESCNASPAANLNFTQQVTETEETNKRLMAEDRFLATMGRAHELKNRKARVAMMMGQGANHQGSDTSGVVKFPPEGDADSTGEENSPPQLEILSARDFEDSAIAVLGGVYLEGYKTYTTCLRTLSSLELRLARKGICFQ